MFKVTDKKNALKVAGICLVSLGLLSGCQSGKEDHYANLGIPDSEEVYPKNIAVSKNETPRTQEQIASTKKVAKDFGQKGTAATYKESTVGNLTASGEPYDDMAMTGGHNSLPFSSFVKVKNLVNGKETIVRINDRNQNKRNVIQLSYAAAYKLGIHSGGKAPVEITAFNPNAETVNAEVDTSTNTLASEDIIIRPENVNEREFNAKPSLSPQTAYNDNEFDSKPATLGETSGDSEFNTSRPLAPHATTDIDEPKVAKVTDNYSIYLQIGSFRQKENAEKLIKEANALARDSATTVQIYEVSVKDKPMYKVRFGPVSTMKDARALESKIASENLNSLTIVN